MTSSEQLLMLAAFACLAILVLGLGILIGVNLQAFPPDDDDED